jgi:hypothetical protein
MHFYGMKPWKVLKWPWFWAKVAVKAWRDLATLIFTQVVAVRHMNNHRCGIAPHAATTL